MIKTLNLKVEGMTCAHCSKNVEKTFEKVGIKAKVNLAKNTVRFSYDEDKTPLSYLQRLIKQQGFKLIVEEKKKRLNIALISLIYASISLVIAILGMINMILMDNKVHINFFMFFDANLIKLIVATISLVILGTPFFIRTISSIKMKRVGMDLLISLSSLGCYILSVVLVAIYSNEYKLVNVFSMGATTYFDSTIMILSIIYIGHTIENYVKAKSGSTLDNIASLIPHTANKINDDESIETIDSDSLSRGDKFIVKVGEQIPTDSIVISGEGEVDEKVLTGESMSRHVSVNNQVYLSTTLVAGPIICKVKKVTSDSLMSTIVNESYALDNKKGHLARLSDTIASYFTPIIIGIAIITFFINFFGINSNISEMSQRWTKSIVNSLSVLVISCPCAFGLAVPLSSLNGFYLALKRGILFKTGDTFEEVKAIKTIYFDKTGTLTKGEMEVVKITLTEEDIKLAKALEETSNHPLAKAFVNYAKDYEALEIDKTKVTELPGIGIKYENYILGNVSLLEDGIEIPASSSDINDSKTRGTLVLLIKDKILCGYIEFKDTILEDSNESVTKLQQMGIKTVLISGDNKAYTTEVGRKLGFKDENIYSEVFPNDKQRIIEEDIAASKNKNYRNHTCYVGDGINDILALSSTSLKIATYSSSDITKNKANCILLKQKLSLIKDAILISKKVYINIIENFVWAICYNLVLIPFAMIGKINPTLSALLMIISSLTLVFNASRIRFYKLDKVKKNNNDVKTEEKVIKEQDIKEPKEG